MLICLMSARNKIAAFVQHEEKNHIKFVEQLSRYDDELTFFTTSYSVMDIHKSRGIILILY